MVDYDPKQWVFSLFKYLQLYKESYNIKRQLRIQFWLMLYSVGITYALTHIEHKDFIIEPLYFSLIGVVLSLMLVFRLNSSYDRWYEGRKRWGLLVNYSRYLSEYYVSNTRNANPKILKELREQLSIYPWTLTLHLRTEGKENLPNRWNAVYERDIADARHRPNAILKKIQQNTKALEQEGNISPDDKRSLTETIREYYNIQGACERILATPIPFSHNYFIKIFILIYTAAIPFGLFHYFGWWTLLSTFVIGYALLGIEIISEAIEDPFGRDANDLPLELLSSKIEDNINEIFDYTPEEDPISAYPYEWINH